MTAAVDADRARRYLECARRLGADSLEFYETEFMVNCGSAVLPPSRPASAGEDRESAAQALLPGLLDGLRRLSRALAQHGRVGAAELVGRMAAVGWEPGRGWADAQFAVWEAIAGSLERLQAACAADPDSLENARVATMACLLSTDHSRAADVLEMPWPEGAPDPDALAGARVGLWLWHVVRSGELERLSRLAPLLAELGAADARRDLYRALAVAARVRHGDDPGAWREVERLLDAALAGQVDEDSAPLRACILNNLGVVRATLGSLDAAREAWHRAEAFASEEGVRLLRDNATFGDPEARRAWLTAPLAAEVRDSISAEVWAWRAWRAAQQGDTAASREAATKALEAVAGREALPVGGWLGDGWALRGGSAWRCGVKIVEGLQLEIELDVLPWLAIPTPLTLKELRDRAH